MNPCILADFRDESIRRLRPGRFCVNAAVMRLGKMLARDFERAAGIDQIIDNDPARPMLPNIACISGSG